MIDLFNSPEVRKYLDYVRNFQLALSYRSTYPKINAQKFPTISLRLPT